MTKPESPKLTPEQINNIYSNHSADMLHDPESIGNQEVSQDEVTYSENRTQGKKVTFLIKLGSSTRVTGWFFIFLFPIIAFLLGWTGNYSLIPWYLILVVPISVFFIVSGKYIMSNGGKAVPAFLIINIILGFATFPTLLSLIIAIQSFIGYFHYRWLRKNELLPETNFVAARPNIITIVFLVITICAGGFALTQTNPLNPMFGSIEMISNLSNDRQISEKYKFSIRMPYRATISSDIEVESFIYKIPYTVYESGTDKLAYILVVHDYSSLDHDLNEASMLDYKFVNTISLLDGKLVNKQITKFEKLNAISGEFTAPDGKTKVTTKGYYKSFVKGRYIFEIYSIGLDKSAFNKYVESFQFE